MLARWLRLWFGFRDPVDRGTYFRHGAGLMALKYAIDALLIWRCAGRVWTPLNYLSPLLSTRTELLRGAPAWLIPLLVAIAAPPDIVWQHVVTFPDLPPPTEALFRAGVAAPLRARIEGYGVGAVGAVAAVVALMCACHAQGNGAGARHVVGRGHRAGPSL